MKQTIYELDKNSSGKAYAQKIAKLHIKAFPGFFLTQLGESFLTALYRGYIEDESSGVIISESKEGDLLGFVAYSRDYSNFYKGLIKRHLAEFATSAVGAAVKHPSFSKRLFGAFGKSEEVERWEPYVELASIGVDPEMKGLGIGTKLVERLIQTTDFDYYAYINLETDADDNDSVNRFYQNNGFVLSREYVTAEGRRMNEYRYSNKNSDRKRLAIVTLAVALENEKGYSRFMSLARMLSEKYDVDLITSTFQHWEKRQRDQTAVNMMDEPFNIVLAYEPGYKKNVDIRRVMSHETAVENILKILRSNKYDLIYCIIPPNNMASKVGEFAKAHGIKYVVDIEDLWPEAMEMVSPLPGPVNSLLFRSFREDARLAYVYGDAFVGTSDEYRDQPKNRYGITGKPAITVYVGCDLEEFDAGVEKYGDTIEKAEGEFWVTYAGNLGSSYDIKTLIEAAQILCARGYRNIRVKILGGGPLEDEFKAEANTKPCNVYFEGYKPYAEMAAWLTKSDIVINSFVRKAPQSIVTKIGDYLASGKPMINTLSSTEFQKKVATDNFGRNVIAEDPESLANLIVDMMEDTDALATMGNKARKIAEVEFDRMTSYRKIADLVDSLL